MRLFAGDGLINSLLRTYYAVLIKVQDGAFVLYFFATISRKKYKKYLVEIGFADGKFKSHKFNA